MRIAHLSDLHLLCLDGAVPFRLFNKRITGYLNLRFRRGAHHKPHPVRAAAAEIRRLGIDHVVITGDVSNLALEREFELVRRFLDEELGLPPERVSMVPGNHDAYTRGAHRAGRFAAYFAPYLRSDLDIGAPGRDKRALRPGPHLDIGAPGRDKRALRPGPHLDELRTAADSGAFPFVHLRGPAAIIGLSTALPRPPLVASGVLGDAQLRALERLLEHPEVKRRTPVLLQHHPSHNPESPVKRLLQGLADAHEEVRVLQVVRRGLLLHGHLHRRIHRTLPTRSGHVDAIGATSASLLHDSDERMAGFNVVEIDDTGAIGAIKSHRFVEDQGVFREVPIPRDETLRPWRG